MVVRTVSSLCYIIWDLNENKELTMLALDTSVFLEQQQEATKHIVMHILKENL